MSIASLRSCPICRSPLCDLLHTQRFVLPANHPLFNGYNVVACANCGFIYADTAATQADYDRFYASFSKYEDNATSTGSGEAPWDRSRLIATAEDIARILPDRGARIIDIGCANGGLLMALSRLGYTQLVGMDPSLACARNTERLTGARGITGLLSNYPDDLGQFDCLILCHVMEHVCDLQGSADAVSRLLKPGGIVYLEVPDASRYVDFLAAPFQEFNTEHINHFSHAAIANLFSPRGFEAIREDRRVLDSPSGWPYPAIFSILRHTRAVPSTTLRKDPALRPRIDRYIAESAQFMARMDQKLREVCALSEVIVWGTGQLAMKLLAETALGQARIAAFVDGNPVNRGKSLRDIPILAPDQVKSLPPLPIVITTTLHQEEIARTARNLGLTNALVMLGHAYQPRLDK